MTADRARTAARRGGRLLGALAAIGVAGCSSLSGPNGDADAAEPEDRPGDAATAAGSQDDESGDGESGNDDAGESSADGRTECSAADREELYQRLDDLEAELAERSGLGALEAYDRRAYAHVVEQLEDGFPDATLQTAERVAREVRESVLALEVYVDGEPVGGGTGWYVDDSHVFTNAHVVHDGTTADAVTGYTVEGDEVALDVVGVVDSLMPDLALLAADRDGPPLPTAPAVDLEEGQPLLQVGHPSDVGYWVTTIGKFVNEIEMLSDEGSYASLNSTVQGREGVSGSPLLDLDGNVVGITTGATHPGARDFGAEATPAPEVLYDVPLAVIAVSSHVGVDAIHQYYDRWTR